MDWEQVPSSDDVPFGPNHKLPPGYRVVYSGHDTLWLHPDGTEGSIHWSRWASYSAACEHHRKEPTGKETP